MRDAKGSKTDWDFINIGLLKRIGKDGRPLARTTSLFWHLVSLVDGISRAKALLCMVGLGTKDRCSYNMIQLNARSWLPKNAFKSNYGWFLVSLSKKWFWNGIAMEGSTSQTAPFLKKAVHRPLDSR